MNKFRYLIGKTNLTNVVVIILFGRSYSIQSTELVYDPCKFIRVLL